MGRVLGLGFAPFGSACQCTPPGPRTLATVQPVVCVSGFGFRVSGFGFRVSGFGFRVSRFGFRVSDYGFGVQGFGFRVLGFGFRVSGFGFRVPGFGLPVSGFGFRISGFGFRVSGFGFRVSSFRFRVSRFPARREPVTTNASLGPETNLRFFRDKNTFPWLVIVPVRTQLGQQGGRLTWLSKSRLS